MNLQIEIYPDYVLVEGQRVNRPTGMSFSQWENDWQRFNFAEIEELKSRNVALAMEKDRLEGKLIALRRGIESALNDAK